MTGKPLAIARLVRLPNLFTAVADILAGATIAGFASEAWTGLALLAAASACLYAFGTVLNDVCDAERDRAERPARPIPAGSVTRAAALALAIGLATAGLALAALAGRPSAIVAAMIVAAIVAYDVIFKNTPLAPPLMGLCRGLNLALGATLGAASVSALSMELIIAAALYAAYVASLTLFARDEAKAPSAWKLRLATLGMIASAAGSALWLGSHSPAFAVMPALLAAAVLHGCRPCWTNARPPQVQQTVGRLVLGNVWFVACFSLAYGGVLPMLATLAVLLPARLLARRIRIS